MKNKSILIINDNHFTKLDNLFSFTGSKFHLFLSGFNKGTTNLSSPIEGNEIPPPPSLIIIDNIKILPRAGYGTALNFYKTLPFKLKIYYKDLKSHILNHDVVLLVAPACTLPISYLICRFLKKPVALYIVGDVVDVAIQSRNTRFCISCNLRLVIAKWEWLVSTYISKRHTTFALGSALQQKLQPNVFDLRSAMTSLILDEHIVHPSNKNTETYGCTTILSVSRLSQEKGINHALQSVKALLKTIKVKYIIIGDGPELANLKSLTSDLGISEFVFFAGYLDQNKIREYYLKSDIFLLPSLSEGVPKVILDAMAAAVPIVSTNVGGIPDLLSRDSSRGWLVEPNNASELTKALLECVQNPKARIEKIKNSYAFIKKHTLENESRKIESILLNIA